MKMGSVTRKIGAIKDSTKADIFVLPQRLQGQTPQPRISVLASSPGEKDVLTRKLGMIEEQDKQQSFFLFAWEITGEKSKASKKCHGF